MTCDMHVYHICLPIDFCYFLLQFSAFIMLQVAEGRGRIHPGIDSDTVLKDMFKNQDLNTDGKISEDELNITVNEEDKVPIHEEL